MIAFITGSVLALSVGLLATFIGFDRERAFYPTVMIVIASYYVLFALMTDSNNFPLIEIAVFAAFSLASIYSFLHSIWLVVFMLVGHGILDLVQTKTNTSSGVPVWWPEFCSSYDFVAAAFLAIRLKKYRAYTKNDRL